ncbi:GNAT family N-acetyltransferase [Enterobacter cancerogenus]|uniref:GNAT family N-acetyltransferase n=1 Tax=Enterobacter cancerogenus TaxID=69218 RepID=UPI003369F84B
MAPFREPSARCSPLAGAACRDAWQWLPGGLVLAPPLRGCGIGTWLLQQLAAWAATLPAATRVELQGLNPSEPLSPLEEVRQREGMTRR